MSGAIKAVIAAAALFVLGVSIATAWVLYPGKRTSLDDRVTLLESGFDIVLPEGDGPHPVVLLFHGCGGLIGEQGQKLIMERYAEAAADVGWATVVVDSYGPRGIDFDEARSQVCSGMRLRGPTRAADVLAAISYLQSRPELDQANFVLAGWSHGGWTVMDLMTMDLESNWPATLQSPPENLLNGLAGVYLTYPFCGFPARSGSHSWVHFVPTSIVVAEHDTVVRSEACADVFARMRADGVELDVEMFAGMTHAFDEEDQTEQSPFNYDEMATRRAHQRFANFLQTVSD